MPIEHVGERQQEKDNINVCSRSLLYKLYNYWQYWRALKELLLLDFSVESTGTFVNAVSYVVLNFY